MARNRFCRLLVSVLEGLWVLFVVGYARWLCTLIRQTFKRIALFPMALGFIVIWHVCWFWQESAGSWLEGLRLVRDSDETTLSLTPALVPSWFVYHAYFRSLRERGSSESREIDNFLMIYFFSCMTLCIGVTMVYTRKYINLFTNEINSCP